MTKPFPIRSRPGIKRDGTQLDGDNYVDGQWCRFQRGLPRKIGGYSQVTDELEEKVYGISSFSQNALQYVHMGTASLLYQARINNNGILSALNDRTPAGFTADVNNLWQFDVMNDGASATNTQLVAHAAPNLADIDSDTTTPIYYDVITDSGALANTTAEPVSGGIVVLHPYLVAYGSGGKVDVYPANDPGGAQQTAFVTSQKIVKGLKARGNGQGPGGLLWALDDLIRATFVGGTPIFAYDSLGEISVLSSQGIIEYDNIYYWPGVDRWYLFNGVLREIPNELNMNWFFDGINMTWRQKVFAFKVPRFGEIWWCYPRGSATECTHAVIYNVRENTWYDTELPGAGRTAGIYAKVYSKPFMTGADLPDPVTTFTTVATIGQTSYGPGTAGNTMVVDDITGFAVGQTVRLTQNVPAAPYFYATITAVLPDNPSPGIDTIEFDPAYTDQSFSAGDAVETFVPTVETFGYSLWQHETGVDEVRGPEILAIESYFETSEFTMLTNPQGPDNHAMSVQRVEPDFVQTGDMTVQVKGRSNARAPDIESSAKTFPDEATTSSEQTVLFKDTRRLMRFRFTSNVAGGDYQMGLCFGQITESDERILT